MRLAKKVSQKKRILNYMLAMRDCKSLARLTPWFALKRFDCARLAARIWELRQDGWPVHDNFVRQPSGKRVKCYWVPRCPGGDDA